MSNGTVKWFSGAKGFGFISPAEGGPDLFVHHTEIQGYDSGGIADNQAVEFEVGEGRKGPQAVGVRMI
jgi:CspA family cold shock protein